jgi:hypothetical protein
MLVLYVNVFFYRSDQTGTGVVPCLKKAIIDVEKVSTPSHSKMARL